MRVGDLLGREPFGAILEQTLGAYWSEVTGNAVEVFWGEGDQGKQEWRGNTHLNFFCTRDVDPGCFENIFREFGYARAWWRRGVQAAYVGAAVTPPLREWLSQVRFRVSEPIPDANQQLVIGGRNRFRIIHPHAGQSVVIAKAGFPRLGFDREVAAREGYAQAVAPRFLGMRANGMAFAEEYFVGTPANRLPEALAAQTRQEACRRLVEAVHRPSLRSVPMAEHLEQLAVSINKFSSAAGAQAQPLADWAARLCGSTPLGVAMTHGDFQNANILVTETDLRIIDWETATERSQLYDLATLSADIRLAPDRFEAWRKVVEHWVDHPAEVLDLLVPIDGRASLLGHAVAWWLEEVIFQLEESRAGYQADTAAADEAVAAGLRRARQYLETVPR